jgi:hypothetical protein
MKVKLAKKHPLLLLLPFLSLLILASTNAAQELIDQTHNERSESYNAGWEFYFDNDVMLGSTKDRNYTGGIALTLAGRRAATYPYSLDGWLGRLEHLSGFGELTQGDNNFRRHAIEFGLTLFTPDDITTSAPIHDDHPYANLLFLANSRITVDPDRGRIYQSNLLLGLLGSSVGEQVQKQIHRLTDSEIPQGWENQISEGGELTFKHSLSVHQVLHSHNGALSYDLRGGLEAGLGYTTDLSVSLSARWGQLITPWWSFTPHQHEYVNLGQTLSDNAQQGPNGAEFYLWGGVQLKYRLYNALLQGQFRDSAVTFGREQLEPLIVSGWLGITKTFDNGLGLSFVMQAQRSEIDSPKGDKIVWGGLVVSRVY